MAIGKTNFPPGGTDTSDATAAASDIVAPKTAYGSAGTKLIGTVVEKVGSGTVITPSTADQAIPAGRYGGAVADGKVLGDTDLAAANIKKNVLIFGVTGNYDNEATNPITAGDVVSPHVGFVNGAKITGTVTEKIGSNTVLTPSTSDQAFPTGRYGGALTDGKVLGDADLAAANIKHAVNIFGVAGTYDDEATNPIAAGSVLSGKIGFVNGAKITGTIASKGAQTYTPGTSNQTIAAGQYLSGIQTISGDADLVAGNIKNGVAIFGVNGSYDGPSLSALSNFTDPCNGATCYFYYRNMGKFYSMLYFDGTAGGMDIAPIFDDADTRARIASRLGVTVATWYTANIYIYYTFHYVPGNSRWERTTWSSRVSIILGFTIS